VSLVIAAITIRTLTAQTDSQIVITTLQAINTCGPGLVTNLTLPMHTLTATAAGCCCAAAVEGSGKGCRIMVGVIATRASRANSLLLLACARCWALGCGGVSSSSSSSRRAVDMLPVWSSDLFAAAAGKRGLFALSRCTMSSLRLALLLLPLSRLGVLGFRLSRFLLLLLFCPGPLLGCKH
jgi:hypothetical protein